MAIETGSLAEISLRMLHLSQQMYMVFQYKMTATPSTPPAVNIAEAWWNNVKTQTRALVPAVAGNVFRTVLIRELNNPAGDYAEFDIPIAEQPGTRASVTTDAMPSFNAVGVRLVVGTRVTRPGQKRQPFIYEGDQIAGVLSANILTATQLWANVMTAHFILGAPAALTEMDPIVCRKSPEGFVLANQKITGYVINPNVTSQNSRKIGRGI